MLGGWRTVVPKLDDGGKQVSASDRDVLLSHRADGTFRVHVFEGLGIATGEGTWECRDRKLTTTISKMNDIDVEEQFHDVYDVKEANTDKIVLYNITRKTTLILKKEDWENPTLAESPKLPESPTGGNELFAFNLMKCHYRAGFDALLSNETTDKGHMTFVKAALALTDAVFIEKYSQLAQSQITDDIINGSYERHKNNISSEDYFAKARSSCMKLMKDYEIER